MSVRRKERWRVNVTAYIWTHVEGQLRFLIVRRIAETAEFPGKWEVPGGGVDVDDHKNNVSDSPDGAKEGTLMEALCREVDEEVGIQLCEVAYMNDFSYQRASDKVWAIGHRFSARFDAQQGGKIRLKDRQHDAYRWVSADEVHLYELLGDVARNIKLLDSTLRRESVARACGFLP